MVHDIVKVSAEKHNTKRLKYIFVDCLDVDPTFEDYKDDYEYCINIPGLGLFEEYVEMTPIRKNKDLWDIFYWKSIKIDLIQNFSKERFLHMVEVARVVHADKIKRIEKERLDEERLLEAEKQKTKGCEKEKTSIKDKSVIRENIHNGVKGGQLEKGQQVPKSQVRVISVRKKENVLVEPMQAVKSQKVDAQEKNRGDCYGCTNRSSTKNKVINGNAMQYQKQETGPEYYVILKGVIHNVVFEFSRSKETPHLRKKWTEWFKERNVIAFDVSANEKLVKEIENRSINWKSYKGESFIIHEQRDSRGKSTGYYKIENSEWSKPRYYAEKEANK